MPNKKHNVCIVINNLKVGGAQKLTLEQIIGLSKDLYSPYLVLVNDKGIETSYRNQVPIPKEHIIDLNAKHIFDLRAYIKLIRFLRRERIHILITHLYNGNVVGRIAAFFARTPIILTAEHGLNLYRPKWQTFFDWLLSLITDKIIADSTTTVNHYVKVAHVPRKKFEVFRPTLRTIALEGVFTRDSMRKKLNVPENAFVAMTIGRFVPEKGLIDFLRVARELKRAKRDVYFVLVGYGPMEEKLREESKRMDVTDRVRVVIDPHNAKEYLIGGDVFLLPSITEGGPITLVEAMHAGLVPVATNVGWVKDIVSPASGFIIDVGDYKAMAKHLIWLFDNQHAREKMTGEAKLIAKNSICGMEEWEELFEKLIAQKNL